MKRMIKLANLILMLTLLAACAAPPAPALTPTSPANTPAGPVEKPTNTPPAAVQPQPPAVQISDKPRNASPTSAKDDMARLVSGNTAFALDLYQALLDANNGNLFYSPYSISVALAMTQAGARGSTLAQMNSALHFTLSGESLHQAFNALQLALASRQANANQPDVKDYQLNIANSTWGQSGYKFMQGYLDLLAENYGAGMRLVDFKADPEKARQLINDWVAQQTAQKIKDLIPQGSINDLTRLVLANAIYFNAGWLHTFDAAKTQNGSFTNLDGKQASTPMMNQQAIFGYTRGSGYQAIELPYSGDKLSMLVLLPDAGQFAAVQKTLDPALLGSILKDLKPASVALVLPKYKVESSFAVDEMLKKLGMTDAFDPAKADLSGMDGTTSLYISKVLHKSYVSVDEKGTEAAAATAVMIGVTSMPAEVVDLKIDRPFIFVIRDTESGSILFIGQVVKL